MNKQVRAETGICHFRVDTPAGSLRDFLLNVDLPELQIAPTPELVDTWLSTGGVYVDGVRQRADIALTADAIIRLHTRRKRYLVPPMLDVVFQNADFLVLDKPAGLPTHPTLDNYLENAKYLLEQKLQRPVYTTHRLDVPTAGLLLFALNPEAQARLNKLFAKGRVEKIYHADAERALAAGAYTHYLDPETKPPRTIATEPHEGWWECRLEIENVETTRGGLHRHQVRLHTGKTHQIRAQFAALGAPLCGDTLYGSMAPGPNAGGIGLTCVRLAFRDCNHDYDIKRTAT